MAPNQRICWVTCVVADLNYLLFYIFSGLTICGCDCLLSAEWKSSNKIIARSGPGKGKGDVIVTTRLGGIGTCTVTFKGNTCLCLSSYPEDFVIEWCWLITRSLCIIFYNIYLKCELPLFCYERKPASLSWKQTILHVRVLRCAAKKK